MGSNLEMMIGNLIEVESSNHNDPFETLSFPFFTHNFSTEKFGFLNENPTSLPHLFSPASAHNSSFPQLTTGDPMSLGGRKRKRDKKEKDEEKQREVVHVRAKRGQATDSHSLAERVRREKINQRLRFLQDLVPGCYKTMGMAVMLDVIINYIQSLQNQIEFLSMKLSVASRYYDFNSTSEIDAIGGVQERNEYGDVDEIMRMVNLQEEYGEHSTLPFL